ncbi:MAG: hypothetical protein EOO02_10520 [Chitinophagaceae bacterium]|nr:MAG: hypothetical protein EOO02_10520 [Chitinophagaceae bacterium]
MKKEKLSYLILLVEILAIVWLHSVKSSENKEVNPAQFVKYEDAKSVEHKHPLYIRTAHR